MRQTRCLRPAATPGSSRYRKSAQDHSASACRLRSGTLLFGLRPVSRQNATSARHKSPSGSATIAQHATDQSKQLVPVSPAAKSVAQVIDSPGLEMAASARFVEERPVAIGQLSSSLDIDRGFASDVRSLMGSTDDTVGALAGLANKHRNLDRLGLSDPRELPLDSMMEDGADRDPSHFPSVRSADILYRQTSPVPRGATTSDPMDWSTEYVAQHFDQMCPDFPELPVVLLNHKFSGTFLLIHVNLDNLPSYLGIKTLDSIRDLDLVYLVHKEIERLRSESPKFHAHYERLYKSNQNKDYANDKLFGMNEKIERRYLELKRSYRDLQRRYKALDETTTTTSNHGSLFSSSPFYDANTARLEDKDRARDIYRQISTVTQEMQPVVTELCLRLNPLGPRASQFYQFTAMVKTNPDLPSLSESDMTALVQDMGLGGVECIEATKTSLNLTTVSGRITRNAADSVELQ